MSASGRPIAEIEEEIVRCERQLRMLRRERQRAAKAFREELVREFDAGATIADLADRHSIPYTAVQGVLYRAGRTQRGRDMVREQLVSLRQPSVAA